MPIDDSAFGFTDPTTMALMGALAGASQYAGASRLPQTFAQALGGAGAGMLGGIQQGQQYQLGQQQLGSTALKNFMGLNAARQQAAALGQPMPSMEDIRSGKYQIDWTDAFNQMMRQWQSQQSPGPQFPGSPQQPSVQSQGLPPVPNASAQLVKGNNFGNIRPAGASTGFESYDSPQEGIAAIRKNLVAYQDDHGIHTLSGVINRWAPPNENPTAQLVANASLRTGFQPDQPLDLHDGNTLNKMTSAIILQEHPEAAPVAHAIAGGQYAQNASPTATDAGVPTAGPAGPGMSPLDLFRSRILGSSLFGGNPPEVINDLFYARMLPPGPERNLAEAAAYNKAGLGPKSVRQGGGIGEYNPETGHYGLGFQLPQLSKDQMIVPGPNGQMQTQIIPGALPDIAALEAAEKGGAEAGKLPYVTPTAEAGAVGKARGELPYAAALSGEHARGEAPFEPPITLFGAGGVPYSAPRGTPPGAATGSTASAAPGMLMAGGASGQPGAAFPQAPSNPAAAPGMPGSTESVGPRFPVQTAAGQKDISQVNVNDMFPGGQGVTMQPPPPAGLGYGPPTKTQEETQKDSADIVNGFQKEAQGNQKIYLDLAHLRGILQAGYTTGPTAHIFGEMGNIAQSLGLPSSWLPARFDPTDPAVFNKASTDLVFAAVKKLAGQVRVAEITGYREANPSLAMPAQANMSIVNDVLANGKWEDSRARLAGQFIATYPTAPISDFIARYNDMAPLADVRSTYQKAILASGGTIPGFSGSAKGAESAQTIRRSRYNPATGKIEPIQ